MGQRTGAGVAFMRWARQQIIAGGETHPLAFLIDWVRQDWLARHGSRRAGASEHLPAVQAGHLVSFHSLADVANERFALEDADFNQEKNYSVEMRHIGGFVETTAVEIGGVPVEVVTARMWENVNVLKPKGIVGKAATHPGWAWN